MTECSIATVLDHYGANVHVPLTGWHSVRCPFHDDHQASARINVALDAFICLRCGVKAGSALRLIESRECVSSAAAREYAKKEIGEDIPPIPQAVSQSARHRKRNRDGWKRVPSRPWD
jgi:CHC2 zinc finger